MKKLLLLLLFLPCIALGQSLELPGISQNRYSHDKVTENNGITVLVSDGTPVTGIVYSEYTRSEVSGVELVEGVDRDETGSDGTPVTGIVYTGQLKYEENYKNGKRDGLCRTWYFDNEYDPTEYRDSLKTKEYSYNSNKFNEQLEALKLKQAHLETELVKSAAELVKFKNEIGESKIEKIKVRQQEKQLNSKNARIYSEYIDITTNISEREQLLVTLKEEIETIKLSLKLSGEKIIKEQAKPIYNPQLESEIIYKDGERDGLYSVWHRNGQLKGEGNIKDGKRDGLYRWWHENGQLAGEGNYKDGKLDGLQKQWYENGQLREELNYKDGAGFVREWRENGQLAEEKSYKDGKEISEKRYHGNGQLGFERKLIDGQMTSEKEWNEDGQLYREEIFLVPGSKRSRTERGWHTTPNCRCCGGISHVAPYGQLCYEIIDKDGTRISKKYWDGEGNPIKGKDD